MKLSVSLSADDLAVLDAYARDARLPSRSAALQRAIRLLRSAGLEQEYADAWEEWAATDRGAWERTDADGLG